MSLAFETERARVLAVARDLAPTGLSKGTSGNVSERVDGGFVITPSGLAYDALEPADLVLVGLDGAVADGENEPSSEWRIHRDVYLARPEAGGVVHAHPPFSTTLACLGRDLPAVHYMIAVAGGDSVRCADYATFGTPRLSELTIAALAGRSACLMKNHGMIAFGQDARHALSVAREIEGVAEIYVRGLPLGAPVVLDAEEMARVVAKFETYGKGARRRRH